MNRHKARALRRRPFGEVFLRCRRWEWRLFDEIGGVLLAKGEAADNFEANRALNAARRNERKARVRRLA